MGSKNGNPVLRDEDVEDLVKSSGLSEDEVIMYVCHKETIQLILKLES